MCNICLGNITGSPYQMDGPPYPPHDPITIDPRFSSNSSTTNSTLTDRTRPLPTVCNFSIFNSFKIIISFNCRYEEWKLALLF